MSSIPPIGLGDVSLLDFLQAVRSNAVTEVVGGGVVNATKSGNTITVTGSASGPQNAIYQGITFDHVQNGYYTWQNRIYDPNTGKWADGDFNSSTSSLVLEINAVEHAPAGHLYPMWQVAGGQWVFFSGLGLFDIEGTALGATDEQEDIYDDEFVMGADSRGVTRYNLTRVVYREDQSEILYAYYRTERIDALGNIIYIGPEVRKIIDVPVVCDIDV